MCTFLALKHGEEKLDLVASLDAFIHCSRWDVLPAACLEAASLGRPLLVSRETNLAEYVERSGAGLVLDETSAAGVHARLDRVHGYTRKTSFNKWARMPVCSWRRNSDGRKMQEASSQPSLPPTLPFSDFLATLFPALEREGLRLCILRNYEGFPAYNLGNDVDFSDSSSDLPRAMRVLLSLENIRLVNYTELSFIASVFLEGISSTPGSRSLQVDFWWSLCSRGPPLPVGGYRIASGASAPRRRLEFLAPSPAHEAISLFRARFYGGFLKEKYFPKVQQTFVSERSEVLAALQPAFGIQVATRLVDAVTEGDRRKILGLIRPLRVALNLRCLLHEPLRGIIDTARYYLSIFRNRFSPKYIETVCILGLGDCGQAAIIDGLIPMLHSAAKVVDKYQFWLRPTFRREPSGINGSLDSRVGASSRSLSSMVNAVLWLLGEWKNQFLGRMELTLRFVEDSGQRLSVDPENYSYHGPVWFARLLGKLFPSPDLWILLDPVGEGLQSRDGKISPAETLRQLEAYRSFVKTRKKLCHSRREQASRQRHGRGVCRYYRDARSAH